MTNAGQHDDTIAFPFDRIPTRIFLDTNIINILVKWPEYVFEQYPLDTSVPSDRHEDIHALCNIFTVGQRACFDICASRKSIAELAATPSLELRDQLLDYGLCLVPVDEELDSYANDLARRLTDSKFMASLPDMADRELIAHGIAMHCDVFCTRDIRSIHSRRSALGNLPIRIHTPKEWWQHIRPWAGLWL